MRILYLVVFLLLHSLLVKGQGIQFKKGKAYNESMDSTSVPQHIVASLHKLVPDAKDISWGHLFCTECPKDGTYSYYQAEFYQDDEQGSVTVNENAQPVAFVLKVELAKVPGLVQDAINKRVKKLEQDFQKINLEIILFSIKEKVFYKVDFYIPTEDKKHWTQYDEISFTEKGNITKLKESE